MALKSLKKRESQLASVNKQLEILSNGIFQDGELPTFKEKISETNQFPLKPRKLEILQVNVGYMCNQVCAHCHVDAGPDRKEIMTKETMQQVLDVIKNKLSDSDFSVEFLADELAISRSVLQRKVYSLTGESPVELIRRIRLNRAAELIENKYGNISEIALEVGFSNPAYFADCFKKQYGVTPTQYQQGNKSS